MSDTIKESQLAEETTLHSPGPIPGIPGDHGPGTYLVNWQERTATPVFPSQPGSTETETQPAGTPVLAEMDAEIARLQQELSALETQA